MTKIVNLLLLAGGIMMAGFGLAAFHVAAILLGFGMIVVASFSDRRRERLEKEKRSADIARRIAELTQAPWHAHKTLKLDGSLWMAVGLMLGGFASALAIRKGITSDAVHWQWVLGGAFFLTLIAIALPRSLASLGKPLLELDRDGFAMPIHGRIPWREVSGVDLNQFTHRGTTTSILLFRVAHYQHIVANIHWTERALAAFGLGAVARGVVGARLPASKENPETVHGVARFLWKQATGHDHNWNSMLSDEYNEAAKRMAATTSRPLGQDVLEHPDEALAKLEQVRKDFAVMRTEGTRVTSRLNWAIGIAMILFILSIAWPWLSRP